MIDSIYITKTVRSQVTGDNNSVAQAFSQNHWARIYSPMTTIFNFESPVYYLEGATYDYYGQTRDSVSFNLNNGKEYTFVFSANTFSISGITTLNHELYRIDFDKYKEALFDSSGTAFTQSVSSSITTPLVTFIESCSGSTGVAANIVSERYDFTFPTQVKPSNNYVLDLFKDRAQYFINPKFIFPRPIDRTIGQVQTYSGTPNEELITLYEYPYDQNIFLTSSLGEHVITGNTIFSGSTVKGAFFTYFVPPQKPNLNVGGGNSTNPVQGNLPTFSPTWNFNNTDDGDYYRLQVTYDITDYTFSTSNVADFKINKQAGDAEFVRTFSKPLTPNTSFLYRIGNTKEITNIFGVKQNLTTWSDYIQATTANDGRFALSGTTYRNYKWDGELDVLNNIITGATWISGVTLELSGQYSNSSIDIFVDYAADSSIFNEINVNLTSGAISQNNTSVVATCTSDANGNFDFGRIEGGTYTLRVVPPAEFVDWFPVQTITINISSSTRLDIILSIIWGNTVLDFMTPTTFL